MCLSNRNYTRYTLSLTLKVFGDILGGREGVFIKLVTQRSSDFRRLETFEITFIVIKYWKVGYNFCITILQPQKR